MVEILELSLAANQEVFLRFADRIVGRSSGVIFFSIFVYVFFFSNEVSSTLDRSYRAVFGRTSEGIFDPFFKKSCHNSAMEEVSFEFQSKLLKLSESAPNIFKLCDICLVI